MNEFCRERDPRAPFGMLIRIAATCLHPGEDQFELLRWRAHGHDDEEMRAFTARLRAAVSDPGQVPGAGLSRHVRYQDGSPGAFLRRLWRDLYGDGPTAAPDGMFAPDLELRELDPSELLIMVAWQRAAHHRRCGFGLPAGNRRAPGRRRRPGGGAGPATARGLAGWRAVRL